MKSAEGNFLSIRTELAPVRYIELGIDFQAIAIMKADFQTSYAAEQETE